VHQVPKENVNACRDFAKIFFSAASVEMRKKKENRSRLKTIFNGAGG
jgi:hypothetical protein